MCPYQPKSDWDPKTKTGLSDRKCDGRAAAMKVNPLRFNVRSLKSYYNRMDIKHALVSGQAGRSGASLQPPSPRQLHDGSAASARVASLQAQAAPPHPRAQPRQPKGPRRRRAAGPQAALKVRSAASSTASSTQQAASARSLSRRR